MIKEIFNKTITSKQDFEVRIYEDLKVKSFFVTPFTNISIVNKSQNEIIYSNLDTLMNQTQIDEKYLSVPPDKRFVNRYFEVKKGDVLRFHIFNGLRGANNVKILFNTID